LEISSRKKNLLVGIQGVDHEVEKLFDFGLEAVGFLGRGRHKIFQKARGAPVVQGLLCLVE
jgi:hypothetical protein